MFCPKCGLQNADETKFCRGCGTDLGNVLAVVEGKAPPTPALLEKYIELYSLGVKGVLLGIGFLLLSALAITLFSRGLFFGLFAMAFAFVFLASGISRFVQARGIKALSRSNEPAALAPGMGEYIKPSRLVYETDDLTGRPVSVTEHTTRHLEMDDHGEMLTLPKLER